MAEFFVRRPIVAMVLAIIIVLVGVVSLGGLPVSQYPEITPPEVSVSASYTGANAEAVEQSVATPLEQKVNGVENILDPNGLAMRKNLTEIMKSAYTDKDPDAAYYSGRIQEHVLLE